MFQFEIKGRNVFGVALNYKSLLELNNASFHDKPYVAPPKRPVLFIKPPNTYNFTHQISIDDEKVQLGANIALVIGKDATRVTKDTALNYVKGITVANDYSAPSESYYRPAVVAKCRDGYFSIAKKALPLTDIQDLNNLELSLEVNGAEVQRDNSANWVRDIPELLETITEFMTLREGDILLLGTPSGFYFAHQGDKVTVKLGNLLSLEDQIVGGKA